MMRFVKRRRREKEDLSVFEYFTFFFFFCFCFVLFLISRVWYSGQSGQSWMVQGWGLGRMELWVSNNMMNFLVVCILPLLIRHIYIIFLAYVYCQLSYMYYFLEHVAFDFLFFFSLSLSLSLSLLENVWKCWKAQ